jgi:hypothetical protein
LADKPPAISQACYRLPPTHTFRRILATLVGSFHPSTSRQDSRGFFREAVSR